MICYASATTFIYPCKLSFRYPKNTLFFILHIKEQLESIKNFNAKQV